jgi:hypothetical protein
MREVALTIGAVSWWASFWSLIGMVIGWTSRRDPDRAITGPLLGFFGIGPRVLVAS